MNEMIMFFPFFTLQVICSSSLLELGLSFALSNFTLSNKRLSTYISIFKMYTRYSVYEEL